MRSATVTVTVVGAGTVAPPAVAPPTPTRDRCGRRRSARRSLRSTATSCSTRAGSAQVVARIASAESRVQLTAAFEQASAETRAKLGAGTVPAPVIVLRSVPVGYRSSASPPAQATVAVWYVGIVGSGATVQPQQSWRTEIVSLVWESGAWKVSSFRSADGPTPPLSTAESRRRPSELFAAIPRFEEFSRNEP